MCGQPVILATSLVWQAAKSLCLYADQKAIITGACEAVYRRVLFPVSSVGLEVKMENWKFLPNAGKCANKGNRER